MGTVHKLREDFDDKLEAAYNRVRDEVETARAKADAFGGPCVTCRHYRKSDGYMFVSEFCGQPLVQSHEFSDQSGRIESRPFTLYSPWAPSISGPIRQVPELCGDHRRLWEAKPTRWRRIFAWFLEPWSPTS